MGHHTWIGLALALVSAIITNLAYSWEHDAAAVVAPLSPTRPLRSAKILLGSPRWLAAFGAESAGWCVLRVIAGFAVQGSRVLAFATRGATHPVFCGGSNSLSSWRSSGWCCSHSRSSG